MRQIRRIKHLRGFSLGPDLDAAGSAAASCACLCAQHTHIHTHTRVHTHISLHTHPRPPGFYQLSKLAITPVVVIIEYFAYKKTVSYRVIAAIALLMVGITLCSVTDAQVGGG